MKGVKRARVVERLLRWATLVALGSILPGCTVRYIAEYDEQLDTQVMQLQRKIEVLLVRIEGRVGTPGSDYGRFEGDYDAIEVDLRTIEVRVASKPQNRRTAQQVGLLKQSVAAMKAIHQEGITDVDVVAVLREQFRSAFVAILTLELAKKRGAS